MVFGLCGAAKHHKMLGLVHLLNPANARVGFMWDKSKQGSAG